jgi:hypothetical protein
MSNAYFECPFCTRSESIETSRLTFRGLRRISGINSHKKSRKSTRQSSFGVPRVFIALNSFCHVDTHRTSFSLALCMCRTQHPCLALVCAGSIINSTCPVISCSALSRPDNLLPYSA